MKKTLYVILILLLNLGSSSAQIFKSKINPFPLGKSQIVNSQDTLKILAVLVEFQEDKYDATIGNGKFGSIYTKDYGNTILDPLPHDDAYFADHLEFAQNYFRKVSNGLVEISFDILPTVFTLSKPMRDYSPPYNSDDLTALGYMSQETWSLADQADNEIDFSKYDLFVIFHPGVSRGLDFGAFYLDRNLPSVYLSQKALSNIFGDSFEGFPVNGGNYLIKNSIILPETESRELEAVDGSLVLLPISINGLIVANIGSYLGLPDLFDTETGLSVIGRFGLMDGQGLFANSGMFPPEPSPWEKVFLGWESPETIPLSAGTINIVNRAAAQPGDITLAKVPINATEYYLVENRVQDVNADNATITMKVDGEYIQKTFYPNDEGYFSISPDSLKGVVVDVDEFDVSVPGNGIVIWHIDEEIINEKLPDNKINVDENRRGVDIEEADGIQDVGVQFNSVFGSFINDGSYEDFWYSENPAKLFENKFSIDTKPNTNSNLGAASLITFENFSDAGNSMSFDIRFQNNDAGLVAATNLNFIPQRGTFTSMQTDYPNQFLFVNDDDLYRTDHTGGIIDKLDDFSKFKPAAYSVNGTEYIAGANGTVVNLFKGDMFGSEIISLDIGVEISAPPVMRFNQAGEPELIIGTMDGSISISNVIELTEGGTIDNSSFISGSGQSVKQICADNNYLCWVADNTFSDTDGANINFDYPVLKAILTKDMSGNNTAIVLTGQNSFYIIQDSGVVDELVFNGTSDIESFIVADIFKDGQNYILFSFEGGLYAVNMKGETADNYPVKDPRNIGFDKSILTADIDNDGFAELFVPTFDGRIFGIKGNTGKVLKPFPLSNGSRVVDFMVTQFVNPASSASEDYDIYLSLIDGQNRFSTWKIADFEGVINWSQLYGNEFNQSFVPAAEGENSVDEFFPQDRAYNWPNPVYGDETNIRYYVSEDSEVSIKIFDIAGDMVAELFDFASGGYDHETIWNVANIESGVYFARVEVKAASGQSDSKIIKVAVIK